MAGQALLLLLGFLAIGLGVAQPNITLKYAEVIDQLRENSDPDVIPIDRDLPRAVEVRVEQSLLYITDVDEPNDVIKLVVRQRLGWRNAALKWDQNDPSTNVDNVTMSLRYLWSPDITASSSVRIQQVLSPELAQISCRGEIIYDQQLRLVLHADLSGLQSPSGATVSFTLESWTYDNTQLSLSSPSTYGFVTNDFESAKFQVSSPSVSKQTSQRPGAANPTDVLTFSFIMKKL